MKTKYRLTLTESGSTFIVTADNLKQAKQYAIHSLKKFGNGGTLSTMDGEDLCYSVKSIVNGKCKWTRWKDCK